MNEGILTYKMNCPKAATCDAPSVWHKPNGTSVRQGHCKPHKHMATCGTHCVKCPACVTEVAIEAPVVNDTNETNEENN